MPHEERLHALDAVRAFALLSGIVLHAAMTFMPGLASVGFPADVSQSMTLQIAFYVIHIFRMTLFFVIAGYFARLVFHRKGAAGFARDRAKRILVPFIVGWLIFGPLTMALVGILLHPGNTSGSQASPPKLMAFPLAHLWFLYYLLLIYAVALVIRSCVTRFANRAYQAAGRVDAVMRRMIQSNAAPFILAAPAALCLAITPNWIMWIGIPSPDSGFTPKLAPIVAFGTAFSFGWLLHRQGDLMNVWKSRWAAHLVVAIAFTVVSLRIADTKSVLHISANVDAIKMSYAFLYTFATWNWIFAIIGAALRFFSKESPARRYIADASYWMYLGHLPIVFALQLVVLKWNLHWSIKFPLVVGVTVAVLLIGYRYLVRYTYLGEVLNGRRQKRSTTAVVTVESQRAVFPSKTTTQGDRTVVAELAGVHKRFGTVTALAGIDLKIRSGEVLAILGPNGAGKSTAISLLLGLQEADAGEIGVFGGAPQELATRRQIGVMLQEAALSPELRVHELIDLTSRYYEQAHTVEEVMRMTNTASLAKKFYGKLSGGQKRLVQFSLAICGRPKLLFLDEPTTGLDIEAREALWAALRDLVRGGCSVVLTTHYLEEAEALSDRVAVLARGRIVALGSVDEVRAVVARKNITCLTALPAEEVRRWPCVVDVSREKQRLKITVTDAEDVARRLLNSDESIHDLEITSAGLAQALSELTKEAA